ncbi:pseudouridine synthase family protein [Actinidia rufa]|uniref:Pseudouridine synthase family protein n=1 Tax=Actinidia rufa TaxID=165716 RepID=A0A7J0EWU5_9ERIC|nr:pseudouridine synthase family protein [Actinidia rufa]
MKTLDEADVGIVCYISPLPGFRGILKQRYSDFIVNEVDLDGNVTHLTNLESPPEAVHNFFKEHFKFFVTDTVDGPDTSSKCIRVWFNAGGNNGTGRKSKKRKDRGNKPCDDRGSDSWPEHLDKFLRFHLYKENKDTQEALGLIGKMLGIQPRSFGFAGTKDKRSVSTQRVTVFKQRASRLAALNERLIGIKVGDFCHVKEGLLLGQLYGNRFTITLRGVVADSEDTIKASADALGKHGFINYFGLQRFGSGSVPTHFIGASLLRGEWKTAVSMILDPREGDILLMFLHASDENSF